MQYINLTQQDIKIELSNGQYLNLPRDSKYIIYSYNENTYTNNDGIEETIRTYSFKNIPEKQDNTIYIVDSIVKRYYMNREDFATVNKRIYEKDKYLFDMGIRFDR